jgi:signal transduction histidine kinase
MGIGGRLLLLLAIPLTGLLVVTGYGVYSGATRAAEARELSGRTDLALASYRLIDDLQAERAELVASDRTTPELRAAVEASTEALIAQAAEVGGPIQADTDEVLRRVSSARSIAERELGGAVALRVYSSAIGQLLDLSTVAIDPQGAIDDAPASVADYLARAQSASAEERDLVTVLVADEGLDAQSFQEVMSLASAQASYLDLAAANAPADQALQIRQVAFASSAADTQRRDVFAGEGTASTQASVWIEGLDQRSAELSTLQRAGEAGAVAAVDLLARNSRLLLVTAALAAIAIVLISALLLRRAVRSIARPLQELAVQAEDVARTRLPEAVATQQLDGVEEVHLPALRASGAAEVHDVARAFNEVQQTALRLASEQAALRRNQGEALTNLGRRNQTLLARQLDFITSLETRETDPTFLDHLFKLDHLASRMRRNAESLLILAGSETPRRRRTPAPISEIVRAAMSEVEEFERVRIGNVREATIAGPAVIDLIHLLAELIENALGFSPPDTTVEIDGRSLGQGGYQFAVIDHGVGMTDVELLAANHRLRGLDELEGMPTRYLGQYVVARLATKTGALVRLQPSAGGRGVTALVILPSSALVGERDRDAVAQPLPGSRAAREQGPVPFAPGTAVAPAGDAVPVLDVTEVLPPVGADVESSAVASPTPAIEEPAAFSPLEVDAVEPAPEPWQPWSFDEPAVAEQPVPAEPVSADEPVASPDSFAAADSFVEADSFAAAEPVSAAEPFAADPFVEAAADELAATDAGADTADAADDADDADLTTAGLDDAASWLTERRLPEPGVDPWQSFLAEEPAAEPVPSTDGVPAPALDDGAVAPPPAPPTAPVQPGWVPAEVVPLAEPVGATAEPFAIPQDAPAGATGGAGAGAAAGAADRVGGLARRVPGASLAESRGRELGATATPAPSRSADAVRSMLSSFQAGRHRGREVEPDAAADAAGGLATEIAPSNSSDAAASEVDPYTVQDGRFPQ